MIFIKFNNSIAKIFWFFSNNTCALRCLDILINCPVYIVNVCENTNYFLSIIIKLFEIYSVHVFQMYRMITFQAAVGPYVNDYHERLYTCYNTLADKWIHFAYWMYIVAIQFLIPLGIMIFCYTRIGLTLMSSLAKQKSMQEGSNK